METLMAMQKLDRRTFLVRAAQIGAVAAAAPVMVSLVGCSKKEEKAPTCTDTTGLTSAQIDMRNQLQYVDVSPKGEVEDCANCALYTEAKDGQFCGGCTLLAGPISPKGYCISWAPKA